MKNNSDLAAVGTSFSVSLLDFSLNLTLALVSGSAVLLSQAMQGLSDLFTAAALLVGVRRSKRLADQRYQFGYGREVFFFAMIAGVMMFVGTGLLSVYFGWQQLVAPEPLRAVPFAIGLLVFGAVGNSYAAWRSARRLRAKHPGQSLAQMARSTLVETKTTFAIDAIGTLAAILGLISLGLYSVSQNPMFDGLGSIVIGLMTMASSLILLHDVRGLIVGRSAKPELVTKINGAVGDVAHVQQILDLRTMYVGPAELLIIIEVHIEDDLTTDQIELLADEIKLRVKSAIPEARIVQVEAETPDYELN